MMQEPNHTDPAAQAMSFAPLAIRLLKGVVYEEDARYWNDLVKVHELPLRRYFVQIGLDLIVNREEGFAYLRQAPQEETEASPLPRLMTRRSLTVDQSILCVLLREHLEDYTVNESASREPILTLRDMRDMVELFFRERNTQQRFLKDVKKTVEDVKKQGFLEELNSGDANLNDDEIRYRVKRILKAFIGPDELLQLAQQIANL
ncbi:MAG: DUF4194 domain-containing protein [Saprospiraceae bacterium]|nr:DUF4194 domain-containing protein [Saprospiraceae bacterium]